MSRSEGARHGEAAERRGIGDDSDNESLLRQCRPVPRLQGRIGGGQDAMAARYVASQWLLKFLRLVTDTIGWSYGSTEGLGGLVSIWKAIEKLIPCAVGAGMALSCHD